MTFITSSDAKELFWGEIGVADKFKPQHAKFLKFLESHDTVTYEDVMKQIDSRFRFGGHANSGEKEES